MRIIKKVTQGEVFSHWEKVEKISITQRFDIVFPVIAYSDIVWNLAEIETSDPDSIFIISSDDWKTDKLCEPDFKLETAIRNYTNLNYEIGKYADIKIKENLFISKPGVIDTKFILVADDIKGPFTIVEGNKRLVALGKLNKITSIIVYLGISPSIKSYIWARHMYEF